MQILVIWEAGTNFTQMKQTLKLFSLWEKSPVVLPYDTPWTYAMCSNMMGKVFNYNIY